MGYKVGDSVEIKYSGKVGEITEIDTIYNVKYVKGDNIFTVAVKEEFLKPLTKKVRIFHACPSCGATIEKDGVSNFSGTVVYLTNRQSNYGYTKHHRFKTPKHTATFQ